MVVSGLVEEIKDQEDKVNNFEVPVPYIVDQIKDKKDRLETEIEKDDMERAKLTFAEINLEGFFSPWKNK